MHKHVLPIITVHVLFQYESANSIHGVFGFCHKKYPESEGSR